MGRVRQIAFILVQYTAEVDMWTLPGPVGQRSRTALLDAAKRGLVRILHFGLDLDVPYYFATRSQRNYTAPVRRSKFELNINCHL